MCNEREAEKHLNEMFGCTVPSINSPNNLSICPPNGNSSKVSVGIFIFEKSYFRQLKSFTKSWEDRMTNVHSRVRTRSSTLDFLSQKMETQVCLFLHVSLQTTKLTIIFKGNCADNSTGHAKLYLKSQVKVTKDFQDYTFLRWFFYVKENN